MGTQCGKTVVLRPPSDRESSYHVHVFSPPTEGLLWGLLGGARDPPGVVGLRSVAFDDHADVSTTNHMTPNGSSQLGWSSTKRDRVGETAIPYVVFAAFANGLVKAYDCSRTIELYTGGFGVPPQGKEKP